ncbi:unnamed protein product [Prunus armeniaca]
MPPSSLAPTPGCHILEGVDDIQLLQLKVMGLISGVQICTIHILLAAIHLHCWWYRYSIRTLSIGLMLGELIQLLWKLPFSKRALRAYHLPDEEQRQIQMITAELIQLVHYSANLPEPLRQESSGNSILELSLDADYPTKGHEAATEACCHFWTRVLQRFASAKTQEASELKVMMENLVTVLLTTLNLPEYPASAPILQVLCVLLLQNAGLKSKDIGARTRAIDLLGTIAARLKRDSALGSKDKFWILQELASLMENSPVIRAKALRAVSIIVEADLQVLGDKRVQSAVEGRFCDSAISVREAALELVGRHIASHPDVAERVKDTGVSVRKRSIKIIRDVCVSNANFSEFTKACIAIISRTSDDESSIKDIVCKTFYDFWFEEPTGSQTQFFGDGSSVPLEVAKKTEQIVEMLRRMPSHQLLVTVIKSNLALDFFPQSVKAIGINPVSLASVRKRCRGNEEGERRTFPYMLALHAFCVVDPTLRVPASDPSQFVVTLQPYLKSQFNCISLYQFVV